jgi:hypothetical protein
MDAKPVDTSALVDDPSTPAKGDSMTDITIPREAEEACRQEIERLLGETIHPLVARSACLAMLKAWPGAFETTTQINRDATEVLILPLTQEKPDEITST